MPTPPITPNMLLSEPVVGGTLSPGWALLLNANFSAIDQHNHTAGKGVQIPPAGLDINTDLSFQGNNLIHLNSAVFNGAITGTPGFLSIYSDGIDLFYKDLSGNQIQLTKAGSPNAGTGNIQGLPSTPTGGAGISWVNSQSTFRMFADDGVNRANIDAAAYILRYPGSYPTPSGNYIALQAPTSLATGYAVTLSPTLPAAANALTLTNASGNQSYLEQGTAGQVLQMNAGGSAPAWTSSNGQVSSGCGTFVTSSTSYIDVTNLSVPLSTSGRPVLLILQAENPSNDSFLIPPSNGGNCFIRFVDGSTGVGEYEVTFATSQVARIGMTWSHLIIPSIGSHTFKIQVKVGSGSMTLNDYQLSACPL